MATEYSVLRKSGTGADVAIDAVQERGVTIEGLALSSVLSIDA